jgi:hypothetical protein
LRTKLISGTPYPHESATRVTSTRTIERRDAGVEGSSNRTRASSSSYSGVPVCSTRPRPCRRRIRGGPSNAQSITTMRPFSRTWATVSVPLPYASR